MYIAKKIFSNSVTAQALKGCVVFNCIHLISTLYADATVCQLFRHCHCTGTDEVSGTAVS